MNMLKSFINTLLSTFWVIQVPQILAQDSGCCFSPVTKHVGNFLDDVSDVHADSVIEMIEFDEMFLREGEAIKFVS